MTNVDIKIGNMVIPTPSQMTVTHSTTVSGARNSQAVFVGSIIREDITKLELTFLYLSEVDYSNILKLFNTKYGGSFINDVTFYDPEEMTFLTKQMYVGDRVGEKKRSANGIYYPSVALHLIEV